MYYFLSAIPRRCRHGGRRHRAERDVQHVLGAPFMMLRPAFTPRSWPGGSSRADCPVWLLNTGGRAGLRRRPRISIKYARAMLQPRWTTSATTCSTPKEPGVRPRHPAEVPGVPTRSADAA